MIREGVRRTRADEAEGTARLEFICADCGYPCTAMGGEDQIEKARIAALGEDGEVPGETAPRLR